MEHSALGFAFEEAGLSRALFRTPTLDRWDLATDAYNYVAPPGARRPPVTSCVCGSSPRVEYELTPLGLSLLEPMRTLVRWIGSNWDVIKEARVGFDRRIR